MIPAEELAGIKARLADNAKLEEMIYQILYANPIAFARKNLAIGLQRYLLGMPLKTEAEAQRELLDGMSVDARAEWWRAKNADLLEPRA